MNNYILINKKFFSNKYIRSFNWIILRWGFLIKELIIIYCGLFVLILVFFFFLCVVTFFTTFRPNFTSGLLQVILPRPRIGMMSLVTVFPVITAFHSCCLSHHVFWRSKPLAGLGRIWNRRDSTPLSAAPRLQDSSFLSKVAVKSPEEGHRWNLAET